MTKEKDLFLPLTGIVAACAYFIFFKHLNPFSITEHPTTFLLINQFYAFLTFFFVLSRLIFCHKYYEISSLKRNHLFNYFAIRFSGVFRVSFILTSITFLLQYAKQTDSTDSIISIAISLFLVVLVFFRPNGLLLVPPTIVCLLFRTQTEPELLFNSALSAGLLVCIYMLLNTLLTGGEDMDAIKRFIEERIICFGPLKTDGVGLSVVHTSNPVNDIFFISSITPCASQNSQS